MQQSVTGTGIPRRPRGAVESMLDNLLESRAPKLRRPANPVLVWCFLLAAGLLFYWFCVREGASHRADAGWSLTFVVMFVFARDENHGSPPWWAFIPWVAAFFLELRVESSAPRAFQTIDAPLLSHYSLAAGEFLLFILLCIVFLPDKRRPHYVPSGLWRNLQAILLIVGCIIACFQARELLNVLHASTLSFSDQFHLLLRWFSRSTLILYALFACRDGTLLSVRWWFTRRNSEQVPASS
jgi:hypothetical protein